MSTLGLKVPAGLCLIYVPLVLSYSHVLPKTTASDSDARAKFNSWLDWVSTSLIF